MASAPHEVLPHLPRRPPPPLRRLLAFRPYPEVVPARRKLLDVDTASRSTCRDLVPIQPGTCPACGAKLHTGSSVQPALFIHGGFGEAREKIERSCACGWNGVGAKDFRSVNPRRL